MFLSIFAVFWHFKSFFGFGVWLFCGDLICLFKSRYGTVYASIQVLNSGWLVVTVSIQQHRHKYREKHKENRKAACMLNQVFRCPLCRKNFTDPEQLRVHRTTNHRGTVYGDYWSPNQKPVVNHTQPHELL